MALFTFCFSQSIAHRALSSCLTFENVRQQHVFFHDKFKDKGHRSSKNDDQCGMTPKGTELCTYIWIYCKRFINIFIKPLQTYVSNFHSCLSSRSGGGLHNLLGPISRGPSHVEFHHRMDRTTHGNFPVRARGLGGVFLPQLSSQPNPVQPDVDTLQGNVQGGHVPSASSHLAQEALSQCHASDAAQHLKRCATQQRRGGCCGG